MPRELKELNIDEVSIVDKAANKRRLLLLKSETPPEQEKQESQGVQKSAWPSGRIDISLNLDPYKGNPDAMDDESLAKFVELVGLMREFMAKPAKMKKHESATPAPVSVDTDKKEALALAENAMSDLKSLSDEGYEVSPEVLDAAQKVQEALSKL